MVLPGEFWTQRAYGSSDNRGKMLRRDGFALAEERYGESSCSAEFVLRYAHPLFAEEYKPILEEVERILAEAGLDEEEMRKGAAAGPHGPSTQSRNRR